MQGGLAWQDTPAIHSETNAPHDSGYLSWIAQWIFLLSFGCPDLEFSKCKTAK